MNAFTQLSLRIPSRLEAELLGLSTIEESFGPPTDEAIDADESDSAISLFSVDFYL